MSTTEPAPTQPGRRAAASDAVRDLAVGRIIGYHLTPVVAPEDLGATVRTLTAALRPFLTDLPGVRVRSGNRLLSDRDLEVLQRVAAGHTNSAIAHDLGISEDTVKSRCRRMNQRLGARDRAHAVALAYQAGFLGAEVPPAETSHSRPPEYPAPVTR